MKIETTTKTPEVDLDNGSGILNFKGRSIPENSIDFYTPIFEWIDRYITAPQKTTTLNIHLEYFNTSSSKCLLDILKKLRILDQSNKSKVQVNWYFDEDDEDMLEAGEDYRDIVSLNFNMIPVSG